MIHIRKDPRLKKLNLVETTSKKRVIFLNRETKEKRPNFLEIKILSMKISNELIGL